MLDGTLVERRRARSRSFAVPCSRAFRETILRAAARRGVSPSALARAALVLVGPSGHIDLPDPGPGHVELVQQTGRDGQVRKVRRQPTIQVRLTAALDAAAIRRLLALAVAVEDPVELRLRPAGELRALEEAREATRRLTLALQQVAFRPLARGVRTAAQAAYALGLPGDMPVERDALAQRFRTLAPLFHPDTGVLPDSDRLRQLVEARNLLLRVCDGGPR